MSPLELLRHYVTGAVERGEAQAIAGFEATKNPLSGDWFIKRGDGRVSREHFKKKQSLMAFISKGGKPSF
jgi:hypothetical protein